MKKTTEEVMLQVEAILPKVKMGMNRREVVAALGEPTDVSVTTKRRRVPDIYKYGDVELHFTRGWDGTLWLIYAEDGEGNQVY